MLHQSPDERIQGKEKSGQYDNIFETKQCVYWKYEIQVEDARNTHC